MGMGMERRREQTCGGGGGKGGFEFEFRTCPRLRTKDDEMERDYMLGFGERRTRLC